MFRRTADGPAAVSGAALPRGRGSALPLLTLVRSRGRSRRRERPERIQQLSDIAARITGLTEPVHTLAARLRQISRAEQEIPDGELGSEVAVTHVARVMQAVHLRPVDHPLQPSAA